MASLSTRITTDHRDADRKPPNPLSSSKPDAEREKFEEAKDVKKPVEPSITSTELPEGWISRISKGSKKTYYVNALTRTSQWNRPTEPASGKPTKPAPKVCFQAWDQYHLSSYLLSGYHRWLPRLKLTNLSKKQQKAVLIQAEVVSQKSMSWTHP
jgi:hypothetical protein